MKGTRIGSATPSKPAFNRVVSSGDRTHVEFAKLQRMLPRQVDALPMPAEFRAHNSKGRRLRWVGFSWVDEGPATGTEPTLIVESKAQVES